MPALPPELTSVLVAFQPLFSQRVWQYANVLLLGAILSPGRRTVSSALRVMGLSTQRQFQNYHRVLNRAVWSGGHASFILLRMLVATFIPTGPLVVGRVGSIAIRWALPIPISSKPAVCVGSA
jgi:hypothetical protein